MKLITVPTFFPWELSFMRWRPAENPSWVKLRRIPLIELRMHNPSVPIEVSIADHYAQQTQSLRLQNGTIDKRWQLDRSSHWYDLTFTRADDAHYLRRLAGRIETGTHGSSDPGSTRP